MDRASRALHNLANCRRGLSNRLQGTAKLAHHPQHDEDQGDNDNDSYQHFSLPSALRLINVSLTMTKIAPQAILLRRQSAPSLSALSPAKPARNA
jgi:hypothetical protein